MECRLGTEDPEDSCGNDSTVSSFSVLRLDYVSALSGGSLILSDDNHSHCCHKESSPLCGAKHYLNFSVLDQVLSNHYES